MRRKTEQGHVQKARTEEGQRKEDGEEGGGGKEVRLFSKYLVRME